MIKSQLLSSLDVKKLENFFSNLSNVTSKEDLLIKKNLYCKSLEENLQHFYINGIFENDELISIACGYTYGFLYNKPVLSLPFWFLGFVGSLNIDNKIPTKKIGSVVSPIIRIMEKNKLYSFYMNMKFPKNVSFDNCQKYLDNAHSKVGRFNWYDSHLEYLISDSSDIKYLPNILKLSIPTSWPSHKQIGIMRYYTKYSYRHGLEINNLSE